MFRSLRARIAASHAIVLFVMLVALGWALQFLLARALNASATAELRASATGVAAHVEEAGRATAPPDSDVPSDAATRIAVYRPDGSAVGERHEIPPWLRRYPAEVTDVQVGGEPVRVVVVPATTLDGATVAWVAAGRSLVAEADLVHRVRMLLLAGGVVAVAVSMAAGWWLAGRAVVPVERAFRAQAAFAADASHELRTPLTFIRQGVEVLAAHDRPLGNQVLEEVDRVTALTGRLLDLARTEGIVRVDAAPFAVAPAVESACRRSSQALGVRLRFEKPRVDLVARGDRVDLEAALDAILENVARHGGGDADVHVVEDAAAIRIIVTDHGPGMPEELHHHAFERFFRADPSRRPTGGAGLGLALARALLEAQGGSVRLSTTPGGGITVTLTLPAATSVAPPAPVSAG